MKPIVKIFCALLIMTITVVCVDIVFGYIANTIFTASSRTKVGYALKSDVSPELLFVGSSRASHHYDTPFINDSLGISAFNLGQDGRGLTYHDALLRAYLQHHTPNTVILELLPEDLSGQINNRVKALYPYIANSEEIKNVAINVDKDNKYLLISNLLRYNSECFQLSKNLFKYFNADSYGYIPLKSNSHQKRELEEKSVADDTTVNKIAKECLIDIITLCKKKNINLIVSFSPEYYIRSNENPIFAICDSMGIKVVDARRFRLNLPASEYFNDNFHLNDLGARAYTKYFMDLIMDDMRFDSLNYIEVDTTLVYN